MNNHTLRSRIKTRQERIANGEYREDGKRVQFGRAGRDDHELNPWSYEPRYKPQRSWKKHRKRQYKVADATGKI